MSATSSEKSAVATRGRSVISKPLNTSGKAVSSSRPPSASSTVSSKSSVSRSSSSAVNCGKTTSGSRISFESDAGFKVTKTSSTTVTLQTQWTSKPASEPIPPQPSAPQAEADPLQVAAQVYPWTYMTSTLEACFKDAEAAATTDLEARTSQLSVEESETADERARLGAERMIEFFDELASDPFAKEAPAIMHLFHSHGAACTRIESDALKLAMRDVSQQVGDDPLKVYHDMLHDLESLQDEANRLQDSITQLTLTSSPPSDVPKGEDSNLTTDDVSSARSQVKGVFTACIPVLRARIANLSMAQELIDSALENVSLGLRMESMGLID